MRNLKLTLVAISLLLSITVNAAKKPKIAKNDFVSVKVENPSKNGAKWVRLQVLNDNIIRVEATPEDEFPSKTSLIIVPQTAKPSFTVNDENGKVTVVDGVDPLRRVITGSSADDDERVDSCVVSVKKSDETK